MKDSISLVVKHAMIYHTLVGDFNIVNPDVCAPYVNAIKTTFVGTTNNHVVNLAVAASIQAEMERRS
jgi:hypothetical protein